MPEPMNDNARIVREALENCTTGYAEESSNRVCSGCGSSIGCEPNCPVQDAITALDCLESELATAKADLARAREEGRFKMDPQPLWEEDPIEDEPGCWVGRFRVQVQGADGEPDVDVDCFQARAPVGLRPVLIDGVWYWTRAALAPEQKGHPETTQQ